MNLEELRQERQNWMTWKNIAPLREALEKLETTQCNVTLGDRVKIEGAFDEEKIYQTAKALMPWRKGPFEVGAIFIDSEWQSNIKYNLLRPHFNLKEKRCSSKTTVWQRKK